MRNHLNNPASLLRSATYLVPVAALIIAPLAAAILPAQSGKSVVTVRDAGKGTETWVLLSGTLGGVSGMHRLETRLVAGGARVVTIDVYGLSVDSADVSFAALARRVDATLERLQVQQAHVVGHAHGGHGRRDWARPNDLAHARWERVYSHAIGRRHSRE